LWNRVLPFRSQLEVPNIAAVLMRTTEVGSKQKADEARRDADLWLRPPINQFGMLEFESIDKIVEAGYRYTLQKLEELKSSEERPGIFRAT
jgi:predicted acylesterase/phospholipase RssA